jgi:hypothetical protein
MANHPVWLAVPAVEISAKEMPSQNVEVKEFSCFRKSAGSVKAGGIAAAEAIKE